jgi:glycolate oxidase FAD binding subunit
MDEPERSPQAQPTPAPMLQDHLAAIVGAQHVHVHEGGTDGLLTAAPANLDQVAAILRHANAHGVTVAPFGAGTKQAWGNPDHSSLRLETGRLNSLREHTWQDMTCTVEAGCTWSSMQSQLSRHGQFVALDPLWPDRATVGGIVSTNDSGSLRHKFGSLRDLIIGMTLVLADGTIARTGGKVVKNVAGYDLHKLMTGAFGTLAVITEVTFRLHSLPIHTRTVSIASSTAGPLCQLMLALLDSQLSIQAMQLASEEPQAPRGPEDTGAPRFRLDVQLASLPDVLDLHADAMAARAHALNLRTSAATDAVWGFAQQIFEPGDSIVAKATMLPSAIEDFILGIQALGGVCVAQAVGVAAASVPAESAAGLLLLRQRLEQQRGSLVILRQPSQLDLDVWGAPPDSLPLMRQIKRQFDPHRTLNPGRFLGGI